MQLFHTHGSINLPFLVGFMHETQWESREDLHV